MIVRWVSLGIVRLSIEISFKKLALCYLHAVPPFVINPPISLIKTQFILRKHFQFYKSLKAEKSTLCPDKKPARFDTAHADFMKDDTLIKDDDISQRPRLLENRTKKSGAPIT
jgi:hypothetical protein